MKEKPKEEHSMTSEINNFDNAIKFLERIKDKHGQRAVDNIIEMLKVKLKRKILEEV